MAIALVAGIALSSWQAVRATRAERSAEEERDRALTAEKEAKEQRQLAKTAGLRRVT